MQLLQGIKAVIFDFNGTLFNDTAFHNKAWTDFAAGYGISLNPADLENYIHGFTNREILEFLFHRKLQGEELVRLYEEKEEIYRQICRVNPKQCILTPGAEAFLDYLRSKSIPCTIASASYLTNVKFYFELFQLNRWFNIDRIIYDSGEYKGKPNPDMFLAAALKIGTAINDCMIIEDSVGGIQAARNAGAKKLLRFHLTGMSANFDVSNSSI